MSKKNIVPPYEIWEFNGKQLRPGQETPKGAVKVFCSVNEKEIKINKGADNGESSDS